MRLCFEQQLAVGKFRYAPWVQRTVCWLWCTISPAGWLTGKCNSKQVEEALPEGPLFHYNPSKWNQSGTMHPTVASKRSPHLSLSLVHKSFPLWRPSHLKSAVSHWQDKVATVFLIAMLIYRQRVSCLYKKRTLLQIAFFFVYVPQGRQRCIAKSRNVACKCDTEYLKLTVSHLGEVKTCSYLAQTGDECIVKLFNGTHLFLRLKVLKAFLH